MSQLGSEDIEQLRGIVLYRTIHFELLIDKLIVMQIKPKDEQFFEQIFLNGSMLDSFKKTKILEGLGLINDMEKQKIRRVFDIRNAFAHAPVFYHQTFETKDNVLVGNEVKHQLATLSNNGVLKYHNPKALFKEFDEKLEISRKIITDNIKKLNDQVKPYPPHEL